MEINEGVDMGKVRVGINGFGRIGRTIVRNLYKRTNRDIEIVALNDLCKPETLKHLFIYDSNHGKFPGEVGLDGDTLSINGDKLKIYNQRDPAEIPWHEHNIDIVIDSTGIFKDKDGLGRHMINSPTVKKVIMCAPGSDLDGTFVMGINHETYDPNVHNIISNGSCTTNCLAPITKVLNDTWGVEYGTMCTIHSYTLDQRMLDADHKDLRRSRAGAVSIIPTSTGAAKAIGLVIPELAGKLDGYALRVPTSNVSIVDLSVKLKKTPTAEEVNNAMKKAAESNLKGILNYCEEPLVSVDYMGATASSTLDAALTKVVGDMVKVVSWYDNETGFSNRVIDLATMVANKL